jgi:hypothetical protein
MDLRKVWPILLIVFGCLTGESEYGNGILPVCYEPACNFKLDFNQDGLVDSLVILKASERSQVADNTKLVALRGGRAKYHPGKQILLGIRLSGTESSESNTYAIFDEKFFSTPIWDRRPLPVEVIMQEDISSKGYEYLSEVAMGDVIALGTEAGIDVYLYWARGNFGLFEPNVEP